MPTAIGVKDDKGADFSNMLEHSGLFNGTTSPIESSMRKSEVSAG